MAISLEPARKSQPHKTKEDPSWWRAADSSVNKPRAQMTKQAAVAIDIVVHSKTENSKWYPQKSISQPLFFLEITKIIKFHHRSKSLSCISCTWVTRLLICDFSSATSSAKSAMATDGGSFCIRTADDSDCSDGGCCLRHTCNVTQWSQLVAVKGNLLNLKKMHFLKIWRKRRLTANGTIGSSGTEEEEENKEKKKRKVSSSGHTNLYGCRSVSLSNGLSLMRYYVRMYVHQRVVKRLLSLLPRLLSLPLLLLSSSLLLRIVYSL
jgi:hypothetical protein